MCRCVRGGRFRPPKPFGEVHPGETAVVLGAAERDLIGGAGVVLGEQLVDERIHAGKVVGHGEHATSSLRSHRRRG